MPRLRQLDTLFMEDGGAWCSTVIMVASQNKAPILGTVRLFGPLKSMAFAYVLLFSYEDLCVLPIASIAAGLRRFALRSCLMAA